MEKFEGKRSAKSVEEVFGDDGAMGNGVGITKRPKNEGDGVVGAGSKVVGIVSPPKAIEIAIKKERPRTTTKEEKISIERPTKRPRTTNKEEKISIEKERPRTTTKEEEIASEKGFMRRILQDKQALTRPHVAPGKDGKRRVVVRLDKEAIEIKMRRPPPRPYPRMSDRLIDKLERPECPGRIRAMEDELTADGQKCIDRDAEMRRQYELQGYADLEYTDDDDDDWETNFKNWRSWTELKELGVVDG